MSERPEYTDAEAVDGIQETLRILGGRWKLLILFQLFGGKVLRFSELERGIAGISQKMLIQQLRQMEKDNVVVRIVYPEVPPRVEYHLTAWGEGLCPALDGLLMWLEAAPDAKAGGSEPAQDLSSTRPELATEGAGKNTLGAL